MTYHLLNDCNDTEFFYTGASSLYRPVSFFTQTLSPWTRSRHSELLSTINNLIYLNSWCCGGLPKGGVNIHASFFNRTFQQKSIKQNCCLYRYKPKRIFINFRKNKKNNKSIKIFFHFYFFKEINRKENSIFLKHKRINCEINNPRQAWGFPV